MASQQGSIYMDMNYKLHFPKGASQLDDFPEELKDIVHPFWGEFPPQHPMITDLFGVLFFLLWVVAFCGNGLVIFVFLTTSTLRTATNIFIVNLALSDLLMMSTQGLPVAINAFMSSHFMYSSFMCRIYGCIGGIFGTNSLMTMVVIGYDRYNVIVKGFQGAKITAGKAVIILAVIWLYSTIGSLPPFLFGWGDYSLEGLLITCSYDYLTEDWNHKSFVLYAFICNYVFPMITVIFFYSQIVKAVVSHEAALRKQAQKMNVDSLRSNADSNAETAEVRIAKVAVTNVALWALIWTPYAAVVLIAAFGNRELITPLVSQIPSFMAKTASCLNPIVFAVSHPKYREALTQKFPCLGIREESSDTKTVAQTVQTQNA